MKLRAFEQVVELIQSRDKIRRAREHLQSEDCVYGPIDSAVPGVLADLRGRRAIQEALLAEAQRRLDGYEVELHRLGVELDDDG